VGETKQNVYENALLMLQCINNALAHGVKHFDERKLDDGIEEEVTDVREILKLLRDGYLIVEEPKC
jgi:hypothetical protein